MPKRGGNESAVANGAADAVVGNPVCSGSDGEGAWGDVEDGGPPAVFIAGACVKTVGKIRPGGETFKNPNKRWWRRGELNPRPWQANPE